MRCSIFGKEHQGDNLGKLLNIYLSTQDMNDTKKEGIKARAVKTNPSWNF
jgi:hypothetical protein